MFIRIAKIRLIISIVNDPGTLMCFLQIHNGKTAADLFLKIGICLSYERTILILGIHSNEMKLSTQRLIHGCLRLLCFL